MVSIKDVQAIPYNPQIYFKQEIIKIAFELWTLLFELETRSNLIVRDLLFETLKIKL